VKFWIWLPLVVVPLVNWEREGVDVVSMLIQICVSMRVLLF
jgi:hypothetical protein